MDSEDAITIAEGKDALTRSGYLLESRVEQLLRRSDYYANANQSYVDPTTGRSREIDIFAIRFAPPPQGVVQHIFAVLLIECVNNPHPLGVITKNPVIPEMHHHEIKVSGLPAKLRHAQGQPWEKLATGLGLEEFHHYCKGRIATQYCSFQRKKEKNAGWMAWHDEQHFDAFRKLCDAVDYFEAQHYANWTFGDAPENPNLQVYYPLLVLQGHLWDVSASKQAVKVKRVKQAQFRRSVAEGLREREYQIDIVEEGFLGRYLRQVDAEMAEISRRIAARHADVEVAIEEIVRGARAAGTIEQRRAIMAQV